MANTLVKLREFLDPTPSIPARYMQRTYLVEKNAEGFTHVQVSSKEESDYESTYSVTFPDEPLRPRLWITKFYKRVPSTKKELVAVTEMVMVAPEIKASAPTYILPAWDASALSINSFQEPMQVAFNAEPSNGGAVVAGLVIADNEAADPLTSVTHGFKIDGHSAYVHTSAIPGVPSSGQDTTYYAPFAQVSDLSEFRITAVGGVVRYFVDDALMAESPSFTYNSQIHLGAALYAAGDKVTHPSINALDSSGHGIAQLSIVSFGSDSGYAFGAAHINLSADGEYRSPHFAIIGPLYALGGDFQPADGSAHIGPVWASGHGYTGTVGEGSAAGFLALQSIGSDYNYAYGYVTLVMDAIGSNHDYGQHIVSVVRSECLWAEGLETFIHRGVYDVASAACDFDVVVTSSEQHSGSSVGSMSVKASIRYTMDFITKGAFRPTVDGERVIDVAIVVSSTSAANHLGILLITDGIRETASAAATLSSGLIKDASLRADAAAEPQYNAQQSVHAALDALAYAGVAMGEPGKNLAVWSVNPKSGSASYEDFPFNSFARIGGRYYGAADGGIYALVGDDDAGAPIHAHMNLGQRNFGTAKLKAMPYAYLGVASDGLMVVRVTTEGESHTYKARAASTEMQTQRVDFGRGLRANYFTLELMNEGGADFSLDTIELAATPLNRRI